MSSTTGPSPQPVPSEPPPTRGRLLVPWSWPAGVRRLLAGLAIVGALGLAVASRDVSLSSTSTGKTPELLLDVNTAPPWVLAALPHVGPALARRIVEARAERPFSSLEDVRNRVRGVGPVTLTRIRSHLRIVTEPNGDRKDLARTDAGPRAAKSRVSRRKSRPAGRPASTPI